MIEQKIKTENQGLQNQLESYFASKDRARNHHELLHGQSRGYGAQTQTLPMWRSSKSEVPKKFYF